MRHWLGNRKLLFFIGFVLGFASEASAGLRQFTPVESVEEVRYLGSYLRYIEDPSQSLELGDVTKLQPEMVRFSNSLPSLGFKSHPVWFHLQLNAKGLPSGDYDFLVDYGFLDEISMYALADGDPIQTIHTGDGAPFSERPKVFENFLLPVPINSGEVIDVYFRVRSVESLIFPIRFLSSDQSRSLVTMRTYFFGGVFGAMALIVLYNVCLWLILRDRTYFLYWVYLAAQSIFQFAYNGHAFRFWWPDSPEIQVLAVTFGGAIIAILAIQFSRSYLDTALHVPRVDRYLVALMWLSTTVIVLSYFIDPQLSIGAASASSFVVPLSMLAVAVWIAVQHSGAYAFYFVAAFGVLILSYAFTGLGALGVISFTELIAAALPGAVVLEGTLLSLGLAHRIRVLQTEKATTLELLLQESKRSARLGASAERFVPYEFLASLGRGDISEVRLGDSVSSFMTIMFIDIRSFTTLSEGMSPRENFEFVNEFLQIVTPIIYENQGFVDKYIGDAVMALFSEDSVQACQCALEIQSAIDSYNSGLLSESKVPIQAGIGIHCGEVMLGTVGDNIRLQTTVISDAVNLASRIEGLTKEYRVPILVSQDVVDAVSDKGNLSFSTVGTVEIKGKSQEATIYSLKDG